MSAGHEPGGLQSPLTPAETLDTIASLGAIVAELILISTSLAKGDNTSAMAKCNEAEGELRRFSEQIVAIARRNGYEG